MKIRRGRGRPPKNPEINKGPTTVMMFACPMCTTYTTECREELDRHLRRLHNLSIHNCEFCHRTFADKYTLQKHIMDGGYKWQQSVNLNWGFYLKFNDSYKSFFLWTGMGHVLNMKTKIKPNLSSAVSVWFTAPNIFRNESKRYVFTHKYEKSSQQDLSMPSHIEDVKSRVTLRDINRKHSIFTL